MKLEIIFSSVVLAILTILIIMSLGYSSVARLFPFIVIIPTVILLVIQTIREVQRKLQQKVIPKGKEINDKGGIYKYLRAPVWMGSFLLSIYLLGYLVGTALFSLIYLKVHGVKWLMTIFYVLGTIALIYGGFELALKAPLYEGLLFK